MAAFSNIYPPILDTYAPIFLVDSEKLEKNICKIYFSLSLYNSFDQIKNNVQVTIKNQLTNLSVLDPDKYPCNIMLTNAIEDETRETDDKYYIEIKPDDIIGGIFNNNQYYKVQIRFTDEDAGEVSQEIPQRIDSWLTVNLNHFSEWSTVCLARGISAPSLIINNFIEGGNPTEVPENTADLSITGWLSFKDENETDTLKDYQIKLYFKPDGTQQINQLIYDSGNISTSGYVNTNEINHDIRYSLSIDETYFFTIEYHTANGYSFIHTYNLVVIQGSTEDNNMLINAELDEDNGRIEIKIEQQDSSKFTGQVIIRRASNKDNFLSWEDIYIENYKDAENIKINWSDYTIECGYWYLYGVQLIDNKGLRSRMHRIESPILSIFEDIFLTYGDKQLKIKFNPSISNVKRVISESRVETIGAKYPFIRRNGDVDYIQFPIGGLVASAMDEDGLFITKEEEYENSFKRYQSYTEKRHLNFHNEIDFIWEKRFRDRVSKFLYDNTVKLFRSPSEGNLLVKLMDISFSPNQTLGRNIQSFTSTAYEIDDLTFDNLEKYNIYTRYNDTVKFTPDHGDEPVVPVQRVVFIDNKSDFPTVGKEQVLYVYDNQIYIWNNDDKRYDLISVPIWNNESSDYIDFDIEGKLNTLYIDSKDLWEWNNDLEEFERISLPQTEKEE